MKKYFLTFLLATFVSMPALAADTAEDKFAQAVSLYCLSKPGIDTAKIAEEQKLKELPAEATKVFQVDRAFIVSDFVILGTKAKGTCSLFIAKLDYDNFWKVIDSEYTKEPFKFLNEVPDQGLMKSYKGKIGDDTFMVVARARQADGQGGLQGLITVGRLANE